MNKLLITLTLITTIGLNAHYNNQYQPDNNPRAYEPELTDDTMYYQDTMYENDNTTPQQRYIRRPRRGLVEDTGRATGNVIESTGRGTAKAVKGAASVPGKALSGLGRVFGGE
jgi:hypothetical protein